MSSLPLLSTFLKSYGRPFLGLTLSNATNQIPSSAEHGELSATTQNEALKVTATVEGDELVEKETRDKFKRMCEGYFETISKQLVKEHLVSHPISCSMVALKYAQFYYSDCKIKTAEITRPISVPVKYLKIGNKRMRK